MKDMMLAVLAADSRDLDSLDVGLLFGAFACLLLASNRLLFRDRRGLEKPEQRHRFGGYGAAAAAREGARQWKRLIVLGLILGALGTTILLLT